MALITERVAQAQAGTNVYVICKLASGWAVMGDVQFLRGYCLLLPDPVVPSLNDLSEEARSSFLLDMAHIGDALLKVTGATRINYEILGNSEPELHAHLFPRYENEPAEKRKLPVWFYDWQNAPKYTPQEHGELQEELRRAILGAAQPSSDVGHALRRTLRNL